MLLQWLWLGMMALSILYACFNGTSDGLITAALGGTAEAISVLLKLCAGYLFFCGLMKLAEALHVPESLSRLLKPLLRLIAPGISNDEAMKAVAMNLSVNMLGIGNAATPMGIRAVKLLDEERCRHPSAEHAIYLLLIANATSLQIIPTTIIALRTSAGSLQPNAILLPTLLCTGFSTFVGLSLGCICRRRALRCHA